MKNDAPPPAYLWFDTEFTSLDLDRARLLQVALVITDPALRRRPPDGPDLDLCVRLPAGQALSPWVEENLAELVGRCRGPEAVDEADLDGLVGRWLDERLGPPAADIERRPVLAGNSLHCDWFLLRRFLPGVLDRVHYRMLDVTALKLLWLETRRAAPFDKEDPGQVRAFFPDARLAAGARAHDAYYDAQASIAELAFYRRHLLAPPDGGR